MYTTKQHSPVSWLAQTCFAAFGKGVQLVWVNQPPCLMVHVKFQFVYTQILLASTSTNVLLEQGSEKAFSKCLVVSNVLPSAALVQIWFLPIKRL